MSAKRDPERDKGKSPRHGKGAGGKHAAPTPVKKQLGLPRDGREKPPPRHAR